MRLENITFLLPCAYHVIIELKLATLLPELFIYHLLDILGVFWNERCSPGSITIMPYTPRFAGE